MLYHSHIYKETGESGMEHRDKRFMFSLLKLCEVFSVVSTLLASKVSNYFQCLAPHGFATNKPVSKSIYPWDLINPLLREQKKKGCTKERKTHLPWTYNYEYLVRNIYKLLQNASVGVQKKSNRCNADEPEHSTSRIHSKILK